MSEKEIYIKLYGIELTECVKHYANRLPARF